MKRPGSNEGAGREGAVEKRYRYCQSCGMPLRRDEHGGGTNADWTRSRAYCSHCFAAGRFRQPGMTAAEMQARVREKLREIGFPAFLEWLFVSRIPRLERWRGRRAG
jgi:hypothetical protein